MALTEILTPTWSTWDDFHAEYDLWKEDYAGSPASAGQFFKGGEILPDGSTISLNKERFIVPELLFKPNSELEEDALHIAIMDVIENCDLDIRPELLNNIFLSGGSSMFPNLKSRIYQELELELARRKKKNQVIRIIAPMERTFSVWIGGSILALIPEFSQNWITRAKYFNEGIPPNLL